MIVTQNGGTGLTDMRLNNIVVADNGATPVTLIKSGSGTLALTGAANTFSGGLVINNGTILVGSNGGEMVSEVGSRTATISINNGGVLWFQPGSSGTTFSFSNSFVLNNGTVRGEDGIQRIGTGAARPSTLPPAAARFRPLGAARTSMLTAS